MTGDDADHRSDACAPTISRCLAELEARDGRSVFAFGARTQSALQDITFRMLEGVRSRDLAGTGDGLNKIVAVLRGFSVREGDLDDRPGLLGRLMGRPSPLARFKARFDHVQSQIDELVLGLQMHQHQLFKDVSEFDRLHDATLRIFDDLSVYIEAGEQVITRLEDVAIPGLVADLEDADEARKMRLANDHHEMSAFRVDLQRRVHDLKLTRQVTMQSLPSIRLMQDSDLSLIAKISSILSDTIPLWEMQMSQAIVLQSSADATASLISASEQTGGLLTSNSARLRQANHVARREMKRGNLDSLSIRHANEELIGLIEETLRLADEDRKGRCAAEVDLQSSEVGLRTMQMACRRVAQGTNPVS